MGGRPYIFYLLLTVTLFLMACIFAADFKMPLVFMLGLSIYFLLCHLSRWVGSKSLFIFCVLLAASRLVTLPLIYFLRDDFTESGWTAIKSFDFSASSYTGLILADGFSVLLIIGVFLLLRFLIQPQKILRLQNKKFRGIGFELPGVPRGVAPILSLLFLALNCVIFVFAVNNKIGITGVEPDALPLKLAGITYYYMKFVGPLILYSFIKNIRSKSLIAFLSLFLLFVGAVTLSRSTIAMWAIPIAYVAYRNCRSIYLSLFVVLVVIIAAIFSNTGRTLMFVEEGARIGIDNSVSLIEIIIEALTQLEPGDIFVVAASLIARLGGGQEMVLGYQTVFPDTSYATKLLFQIFTGRDFGVDYSSLVMLTHDFVPLEGTVAGIAYSGFMLAFLNTNFLLFGLFAVLTSLVLLLNDRIGRLVAESISNAGLFGVTSFVLTFLFFAMFMVSWYWTFILALLVGMKLLRKKVVFKAAQNEGFRVN